MTSTHNFLHVLTDFYAQNVRTMPWRVPCDDGSYDPYRIFVSEIMLQQTGVSRVAPKFEQFLQTFPTIHALADASLAEVLPLWLGLGYNRRAQYLLEAAQKLSDAAEPWLYENLVSLKGISHNTAAAIIVYSYDQPMIFIETNIRTVMIYHFFRNHTAVHDTDILDKLAQVVPWNTPKPTQLHSPRQFYYAMMDYGTYLKSTYGNISKQSKGYVKQSAFMGSRRQIRGQVIANLVNGPMQIKDLQSSLNDPRLLGVLDTLEREKMVTIQGTFVMLYNKTH
jgi:A/G-specific adenine glycosylase